MKQLSTEIHNTSGISVPLSDQEIITLTDSVYEKESRKAAFTEIIFVDEKTIVEVNKQHLNRDYITDIITFSYHEGEDPIEGSLFCCAQRILEQASEFGTEKSTELARVIVHGLLHLCGYTDDSPQNKSEMTARENFHLTALQYL